VDKGYKVTVISKNWTGKEKDWEETIGTTVSQKVEISEVEGFRKIFLPYKKREYASSSIKRKLESIYNLLSGNLEIEADSLQFEKHIEKELELNPVDYIVASCPPWNLVKLTYNLAQKFKIPFCIDCRDFENDVILPLKPQLSLFRKFEFSCNKYHIKKWAKKADLIVGASQPIVDYVTDFTKVRGVEITNGYDEDLFDALEKKPLFNKFTISVLGYLYPPQDLSILFQGFKEFLKRVPNPKFKFLFIGVGAIHSVAKNIRNNMPDEYIKITERIPQKEALEIGLQSHALYYAGWTNWRGVYSAKIFEYLALKKNILIAPGDNFSIDDLMNKSKAGKIANKPEEFADILTKWYLNWENNVSQFTGNLEFVKKYSRKNQANILLENIAKSI